MLLMIDNYDSFTYNLVQYLGELGADITVFRNDQVTVDKVRALAPDQIVISPGPGDPDDGGVSNEVIRIIDSYKTSGEVPNCVNRATSTPATSSFRPTIYAT